MFKKNVWKWIIASPFKQFIILLIVTRLVLSVIGIASNTLLDGSPGIVHKVKESQNILLDVWGTWDSGWYLGIAEHGYSISQSVYEITKGQANYAFFPLYPLLMRYVGIFFGGAYMAGLLISNISLIISCWILYKLLSLDFEGDVAEQSVYYLLFFPTSFILSGVFTESLFLALVLGVFYLAKTKYWWWAGILGFFAALTRPVGVLVVIPLLVEYFLQIRKEGCKLHMNFLSILFPILGLFIFSWFNYSLTGDWLAFFHIQSSWGRSIINPIHLFSIINFFHLATTDKISLLFAVGVISLLIYFYKKIPLSYWVYSLYSLLIPLSSGLFSIPRLILPIFPLYLFLALLSKKIEWHYFIMAVLLLLQGFFMVFWSTGFNLII